LRVKTLIVILLVTLGITGIITFSLRANFALSKSSGGLNPNRDFIQNLQGLAVTYLGSSGISDSAIGSLEKKLTASGRNELHSFKEPVEDMSGDVLFVDGYWLTNSVTGFNSIKNFITSQKPVAILGGNREALSKVISTRLGDVLAEESFADLEYYRQGSELLENETLASLTIWPHNGNPATVSVLTMTPGNGEQDALDSLIYSILSEIAGNWRRET